MAFFTQAFESLFELQIENGCKIVMSNQGKVLEEPLAQPSPATVYTPLKNGW
jgi:hypothetical protein